MRVRSLVLAGALLVGLIADQAAAQTETVPPAGLTTVKTPECAADSKRGKKNGSAYVVCAISVLRVTTPAGGSTGVRRIGKPQPVTVRVPELVTLPGPTRPATCFKPGSTRIPKADYDASIGYRYWDAFARSFPRCPVAPSEPRDPEEVAIEVLERFPLPAPRPYIAPGRAITGLRAYLEPNLDVPLVGGRPAYRGTRSTELGDMAIEATATYMVDWGDERTGPHRGPGGPWPDGNISYVWGDMGTYDVVVTADWVVDWRVGTVTGRLTVPTEGTIAAFPVNQLQAVLHQP